MNRRRFIQGQLAALASVTPWISGRAAAPGGSLLKPVHDETVCRWSAAHPRHDHQLIFPLDDSRLMLVWCEYYANRPSQLRRRPTTKSEQASDEMPCRISARISSDRGRTWSETLTLQENLWANNVKHPNLVRLSETEILFTFVGWESAGQRNVFGRRSTDNGESWGERFQISEPGWYCNNADRALRLSSGRVLLPAHGPFAQNYIGAEAYRGSRSKLHSFLWYSDDGFRTWHRSANSMTAPGRGCHEPTVVELKDGRLLCLLRNSNQRLYRSFSSDQGMTWSVPEPTALPSPEAPALVKRIPSTGDLLLLWNHVASASNWPRTPLTAAISRDEGRTWEQFRDIDNRPDHDAAYPSVTFVGDEALVAYYTRPTNWARDSEVALRIYPVDAFYG